MDWQQYDAALFDLDGVITPTADVHMKAWSAMFNDFLSGVDGQDAYTDEDYFAHVDGKPRYDGVRDFLAHRRIELPEGEVSDSPDEPTVCGLGNRKNVAFNEIIERDGVEPYPGTVGLLDDLTALGVRVAVVSSSKNARAVLEAAGMKDLFELIVDGNVAKEQDLDGKPAPDTYAFAAESLGVSVTRCVVIEDAVSGVLSGHDTLSEAGADLVVSDLAEVRP